MTPEALLLGGLSAVTSTLCVVAKLLWTRSERDRKALEQVRIELEKLKEAKGKAEGELVSFKRCPAQTCPFKEKPMATA